MIQGGDLRNNAIRTGTLATRQAGPATDAGSKGSGAQPILDLATHPAPVVTIAQLAAYWQVNRSTIYRDIERGALPAFQLPGGGIRIRTEDARAYGRRID